MPIGPANSSDRNYTDHRSLVVLLRGAPGVGKSTVATLLGSSGAARTIIEVDTMRRLVVGVHWSDRRLHGAAITAAALAAGEFAVRGFGPVLLVDCFGRSTAHTAVELAKRTGAEVAVFTLWASPGVLRARLAHRVKDYDGTGFALLINAEMAAVDSSAIDTTELTADQVAARVWAGIERFS